MTQSIPFDFVISNFLGNEAQPFSNDLSKLKYPDFTYINEYKYTLVSQDESATFSIILKPKNEVNKCYICIENIELSITELTYEYNKLIMQFKKSRKNYGVTIGMTFNFIINKEPNGINCILTIDTEHCSFPKDNYINKDFFFRSNKTEINTKDCLEKGKSSYNDTYIETISESMQQLTIPYGGSSQEWNSLVRSVKYLGCHLLPDNEIQLPNDLLPGNLRFTIMAIKGNQLRYDVPVIFIDATDINGQQIKMLNNIYVNDGNANFIYPINNMSIEMYNNVLRVKRGINCLFNCIMINGTDDLTINGNYKDFEIKYIGIRKPKEIVYPNSYIELGSVITCNNLEDIAKDGCSIEFRLEVPNLFNGNENFSYYLLRIEFKKESIYGKKCNIFTIKRTNGHLENVYSISNVTYKFFMSVFLILSIDNDNDDKILISSLNNWSYDLLCIKYYKTLAKALFPPGYVFNLVSGIGYSTNDYRILIDGDFYYKANEIRLHSVQN